MWWAIFAALVILFLVLVAAIVVTFEHRLAQTHLFGFSFKAETNYMSAHGYFRWQVYMRTGRW
jgi:hypothetical protein